MGHGSYSSSDWAQLRNSRNITDTSKVADLYQSRGMKAIYDPSRIKVRESRDSKDNPLSTAIIVGLDVTGSMGYLSEEIAKNSLNKTMLEIYDKQPVTNPDCRTASGCVFRERRRRKRRRVVLPVLVFCGHAHGHRLLQ